VGGGLQDFVAAAPRSAILIYVEMMLFVVLLLVGYVFVLKKGLFEWSDRRALEAESEARRHTQGRRPSARGGATRRVKSAAGGRAQTEGF
jgi:hypothetical protein